MRRLVAWLLLSVGLGVATTVAVSWAFATNNGSCRAPSVIANRSESQYASSLLVTREERAGSLELRAVTGVVGRNVEYTGAGSVDDLTPTWARPYLVPGTWSGRPRLHVNEDVGVRMLVVWGWPAPALWSLYEARPNSGAVWSAEVLRGLRLGDWDGIRPELHAGMTRPVALPLRPHWPGFAADAALYSLFWLIALVAPGSIRRALRRGRGRCPNCGYFLAGLAPGAACPECGAGAERPAAARS